MAGNDGAAQNVAAAAMASSSDVSGDVSVMDSVAAEQGGAVTYPSDKDQIYGLNNYKHGTFLSKGEGARSEKYKRWIEEKRKLEAQQLDKKQHSCLVKLHAQSLEVRNELRKLQSERKPLKYRGSTGAGDERRVSDTETADYPTPRRTSSITSPTSSSSSSSSPNSLAPPSVTKGMRKSSSSSSLGALASSSFSSPPSPASRKMSGSEWDRQGRSSYNGAVVRKGLNPGASSLKVKNLHSARALSKLNNGMDIGN